MSSIDLRTVAASSDIASFSPHFGLKLTVPQSYQQARESPRAAIPSMQMVEPITSASLSLSQLQCKSSVKLNSKNNNNIDSISKAGNDIKANSHNTCSSVDKIPVIHTPIQEKDDLKSETLSIENNCNE